MTSHIGRMVSTLSCWSAASQEAPVRSHHKVVSRPTPKSNNGIPNGASLNTAITIDLRFGLLNVKCFSDFRSFFQHARSIAFMPYQSISCGIDCSWTCSAMADLELCPSRIASQCSFFCTCSARKVSPTYSPEHILHFTEYTALAIESVRSQSFDV